MRKKWKKKFALVLAGVVLCQSYLPIQVSANKDEVKRTDFITSKTDINDILKRNYTENVPLGYSEDIFSLYQPGWGFDRNDVFRTGLDTGFGMPVTVSVNDLPISVKSAEFIPSYVTSTFSFQDVQGGQQFEINVAPEAQASASFSQEKWGSSLSYAFDGDVEIAETKFWNTYREADDEVSYPKPKEGDWILLRYNEPTAADTLNLYVYTDNSSAKVPADVKVVYLSDGIWSEVNYKEKPEAFIRGKNTITFDEVKAEEYRVIFKAQEKSCICLNELELIHTASGELPEVSVSGNKYISVDNKLVVMLQVKNEGKKDVSVEVSAEIPQGLSVDGNAATGELVELDARMQGDSQFRVVGDKLQRNLTIGTGQEETFRIVLALDRDQKKNEEKINQFLQDKDPLSTQKSEFTEWFEKNIPYLDVPDETIKQIYYFRWYTYRNNIRKTTDDYYVITEFLPNVSWAGKHNTINDSAGFHVAEGRWLQNGGDYLEDYLSHWLDEGGAVRSYSLWLADAYYNQYLATGDKFVLGYLGKLKDNFKEWEASRYNEELGLFWQYDDRDAMEHSISGPYGYRTTLNSYMYADAMAISKLCALTGDEKGEELYAHKAADIKQNLESRLWNPEDTFYKAIGCEADGTLYNGTEQKDVMEELGYIPWMFHMPDDDEEHAAAWKYVMDEKYFLAPYGLLTTEKEYAVTTPEEEYGTIACSWNGPVWPFATSQTLTGMANLLIDYHQEYVSKEDYFYLLSNYAQAHYKNGEPWLAEDLDGYTGRWIADEWRSPNYNHSTFNDLVITGLFGIRPSEGDTLEINPLLPDGKWDSFCLENVPYHGKNLTLLYDKDGSVYGQGSGFKVYVDGELKSYSEKPGKTTVDLKKADSDLEQAIADAQEAQKKAEQEKAEAEKAKNDAQKAKEESQTATNLANEKAAQAEKMMEKAQAAQKEAEQAMKEAQKAWQQILEAQKEQEDQNVRPGKVKLKSVKKVKKGRVRVKWAKTASVSGYELQYATNRKFKNAKRKQVGKVKSSVTLKKLKTGKKYYFRMRAYRVVNGKKVYGLYSGVRKTIP